MQNRAKLDLSLYLVTDRNLCKGDFMETIQKAVKGGVTVVQLREKECSTREFIELASQVKQILKPYNVPLVINDRIDVALAVDAEGVHLGQSDMPYSIAREILGSNKIIGISVENLEEAKECNQINADYIAISPIFSTPTKGDTAPEFGLKGAKEVVEVTEHKVVAIGGINLSNLKEVMQTGIDGVAVVSAIVSSDNPQEASNELAAVIKSSRK